LPKGRGLEVFVELRFRHKEARIAAILLKNKQTSSFYNVYFT